MAGPMPTGEPAPPNGELPAQVIESAELRTFHAYVHVPFCKVRCGYCDFNTYTSSELNGFRHSDFVSNLSAEIVLSARVISDADLPSRDLASVFFGGGTPTLLPARDLVDSLSILRETFGIASGAEITTEANPDTVTVEYLSELLAGGFNRVSFGMQSAVPEVLQTLERTHDPVNVELGVRAAKSIGLQTSVDLIYGAPGETLEQWQVSVEAALAMDPDHISAYALIVEDGTKLARDIRSGALPAPDEDLQADKYEYLDERLAQAGYEWYELSNWSKGESSRSTHNRAYWLGNDWWGYGAGAHSHIGGVRWWNAKHPTAYSQRLSEGVSPAIGREILDDENRIIERVMLESRLREGVPIEVIKKANPDAAGSIAQLVAEQLIDGRQAIIGTLALTRRGRLLADAVLRRILG
ncbi:MAG: radical SAM family heme chaperone HemW [Microbacteriaceae bacterium]